MKKQILLFLIIALLAGCKEEFNSIQPTQLTKPQNQARIAAVAAAAAPEVYIPQELSSNDFNNSASTWSWSRSRSSDHFIVFWAKPYGTNDPNSTAVPAAYRVNITDLLIKAEGFFAAIGFPLVLNSNFRFFFARPSASRRPTGCSNASLTT